MCAFKPFRNDPSRAQLTVARKISIIHVAYTITISSLSLSLPFPLPLFLFSSIGRFIRLARNGKGCVELRMELLSLNFIIVIFSIEFIELLLLLFFFKYIDRVKKRKYSKFNFSILWIWSWDKIIFSQLDFCMNNIVSRGYLGGWERT